MNTYAQNAVHRFWENGQNFLAAIIASSDISLEHETVEAVEELLDLTKRKMKEFPLI